MPGIRLEKPFAPVCETGVLELVGADEEVNTDDYGGSVSADVSRGPQPSSGLIIAAIFIATETGTGAVQDSAGKLLIFDADPNPTAGDTALTAAEHKTKIAEIEVAALDWETDANGGHAYLNQLQIPYHAVSTLYFVWFHTDSTDLNDAAGDDEVLEVNLWYLPFS